MNGVTRLLLLGGPGGKSVAPTSLLERILSVHPDHIWSLWKLDELSGTPAVDSVNDYDAAYLAGAVLNYGTNPDGQPAARLVNAVNLYSTALSEDWPGSPISFGGWFYGTVDALTNPAAIRWLFDIFTVAPVNDIFSLYRLASSPYVLRAIVTIAGTAKQIQPGPLPLFGWHHVIQVLDTSVDRFDLYIDGMKYSYTGTIADWTGVPFSTTTVLGGANTVTPAQAWGELASLWTVWDIALSDADVGVLFKDQADFQIMTIGDSKTASNLWRPYLCTSLFDSTGQAGLDKDAWAVGGATVESINTLITAQITTSRSNPNVILINLGTNGTENETTFKTNLRSIIETLHATWPPDLIYLARPVLLAAAPPSTPTAANATRRGWINDLIAEYDYVYEGIDETDLEGGDGYVTNLADIAHYTTPAGQAAVAALWFARLGYS